MERTPAGLAHEPTEKAPRPRTSQKQLEKYLLQVLDVYLSKATFVELKLCMSPTMPKRGVLSHSLTILTVICTRKSRQHHWEKTSLVSRPGRGKYSNASATRPITVWESESW